MIARLPTALIFYTTPDLDPKLVSWKKMLFPLQSIVLCYSFIGILLFLPSLGEMLSDRENCFIGDHAYLFSHDKQLDYTRFTRSLPIELSYHSKCYRDKIDTGTALCSIADVI